MRNTHLTLLCMGALMFHFAGLAAAWQPDAELMNASLKRVFAAGFFAVKSASSRQALQPAGSTLPERLLRQGFSTPSRAVWG